MPSNQLTLCHPLLLPPSIFPSIRVFSNESVLPIRWPKYWSFNFSISPSNEYSGLISFRMDWLDLLAVQGTLKSLLQHHSSKASSSQPTAQTLSRAPSPGGPGCARRPGKASDSSQLDTAPHLPGSHLGSPQTFSPAGTPTPSLLGSALLPPLC